MPGSRARGRRRVVAVTGGGGGIGAAIAEALGRAGCFVVTMDPLVTLDGAEQLPPPDETTADRIVAAGGAARATSVSVTDSAAVRGLFERLVADHGGLDGVVNVAGITRPTTFAGGTEDDWGAVLDVHLDGYRNVLDAALPVMAAAGHGRVLGVTSGSGWRPADTGAYGCAKRAVASLTWELGRQAPPGVVVNALSPIAVTRMVTAALERAARASGGGGRSATGGLSLGSMPQPDELGPLGAHLVSDALSWCSGQVIYGGGSEVAVIEPPRLLEVVRTDHVASLPHVLDAVTAAALVPAEADQASTGGANPRVGRVFDERPAAAGLPLAEVRTCAVVTDQFALAASVTAALEARAVTCATIPAGDPAAGFGAAADALAAAVGRLGSVDAVVVALGRSRVATGSTSGWAGVLADHAGIADDIRADAGWARAVADHAAGTGRHVRLVTLTDSTTPGGRSRAQAAAQLARAARGATGDRVAAFAVGIEAPDAEQREPIGEIVAHLVGSPETPALSGAELAIGPGWLGLRGHPRPRGSVTFGGPDVPDWLDGTLREIVGVPGRPAPHESPQRPPEETR